MRGLPLGTLLLATLIGAAATGAEPDPALQIPPELAADFAALDTPIKGAASDALPDASLTEPFEIGEALADPAKVDVAVVSLLARMGRKLPENFVRGLIEMGRVDAQAAMRKGRAPYSFRDLHAAVHTLLPDLSIERLAGIYSQAYESAPDSLVPQVLQGMPIEPGTRLSRPQLWLLLVDGFAPPVAAAKLAQLGTVQLAQADGPGWGAASLAMPPLPSPDPLLGLQDWNYLLSILPMVAYDIPFDIVPQFSTAHEGHGGPGSPVALEARIGLRIAPIISPHSGQTVLRIRTPDRGNRMLFWNVREMQRLQRHGSLDVPQGAPLHTDAMGNARLTFTPKKEAADGQGEVASEMVAWDASVNQWDLLTSHYDISPVLRGFVWGNRTAQGLLEIEWHTDKWIKVSLENKYRAMLDFGILGAGYRLGKDRAAGTLVWNEDNQVYEGVFDAHAGAWAEVKSQLGHNCAKARSDGDQQLRVMAREVAGFNAYTQSITGISGTSRVAGYLALEFTPASDPQMTARDRCQILIYRDPEPIPFIPLNDARWTIQNGSYAIAYPASGVLSYKDVVLTGPTRSIWKVEVERVAPAP